MGQSASLGRNSGVFPLHLVPAQLLIRLGRAKQVRRQFLTAHVIQNLLALFQPLPPVNIFLFQSAIKPYISVTPAPLAASAN
jgi:hypothetical protein